MQRVEATAQTQADKWDDFLGATQVNVVIRNPAEPGRAWEGRFLVDTGATECMAPRLHLESIGLAPKSRREYELADGTRLAFDITVAEVEILGEIVGATVLMGDTDTEPLLGVTALESLGIEVDPNSQTLKKLPAVR